MIFKPYISDSSGNELTRSDFSHFHTDKLGMAVHLLLL